MEIKIQIPDNCELVKDENTYIVVDSIDRNLCSSREEAEAFLALMQLRQLRKAWVGSWEQPDHNTIISAITYYISDGRVIIWHSHFLLEKWQLISLNASEVYVKLLKHYYEFMNKDNNSDHKEDHKDNNSCFDEETIEVVSQLQEPLPFKTTDFIPEPFIPTL
jgi:hypothetical protein